MHSRLLSDKYKEWKQECSERFDQLKANEEELNRIFIDIYGLQEELTPEVADKDVSVRKAVPSEDIKSLISYSVGCMFGRYSLDKEGLILANQGDGVQEYLEQIPNPSFMPDKDNVIPILDDNWFTDDIVDRFRQFVKVVYGEDTYQENMNFIEKALNIGNKVNYTIRDYFIKEFYSDHVKRYQKRPIYWLFSSPKGSFNALIYMHRYEPHTVSTVLNEYLREFMNKLETSKKQAETQSTNPDLSISEKIKLNKHVEKLIKMIAELEEYERDILFPLATQKIAIDLDDGVKVNYAKFAKALKKVAGL